VNTQGKTQPGTTRPEIRTERKPHILPYTRPVSREDGEIPACRDRQAVRDEAGRVMDPFVLALVPGLC